MMLTGRAGVAAPPWTLVARSERVLCLLCLLEGDWDGALVLNTNLSHHMRAVTGGVAATVAVWRPSVAVWWCGV